MVRAGSSGDSEERFWNNVFTSPAFDPVRTRYGSNVQQHLKEKLIIVGGDITHPNLGYTEEQSTQIASDIDLVLNSSGNVSFNPPLETALKTNVTGTMNLLSLVKRMKRPAFVHTSTCFVAGNRSGQIWEDESVIGYFPRRDELKNVDFSVAQELKDAERLTRSVVEEATDATLNAEFRTIARNRLMEEGRDPDDEHTLNLAAARERKDWIRNRMSKMGLDRAQWWGWPNIYTYTKSMGEQLIAAETGIVRSIVRPAIVESSIHYPFPGWNEGFNTTAPLILFGLNGQNVFPVNTDLVLDVIPVDYVASAILTIAAQACVEEPKLVHQLCSGDVNPLKMRRIVTLLGLYKRKHFQDKDEGNRFINALAARMEARPIKDEYFKKLAPPVHKNLQKLSDKLDKVKPYGTFNGIVQRLKQGVDRLEAFTREGLDAYEQFRPFMVENEYQFRADHVRELFSRLLEDERSKLTWSPESLDWYHYWLKIHFPGLQKWVFPKMEEIGKPKPKRVYTYRNLMEMFDAVTKLYEDNVAMNMERNGEKEEYTYADLRELVIRVGAFLYGEGIRPEDRVALIAENSPEWGISYLGVIKAGATCIPIDKDLSVEEVTNILRAGGASGLILSDRLARKFSALSKKSDPPIKIWNTSQMFELGDEALEQQNASALPKAGKPGGIASLIYTSGTTGNPKGVMLTQKNLTSMISQLLKVYDVSDRDGFLSILPMHHTFEFSTGFLLPLSKGAQITYLEELNGDTISDALKNSHVTMIVGVPALWDTLRRRILNKFGDKSEKLEDFVRMLISINRWLRKKTPLNLGPFLFFPVHKGLGGKIRYLISGGSALSQKVADTFQGLGFSLNEGYGLTEASPVLTVARPGTKIIPGSVGEPLPGVEIRIDSPNQHGIGEVIARGPNIMAGYYQNRDATEAAIVDGWLHTGDLGYLDEQGNLFLVGRSKDLIVGASGKNVYPDELEETYRDCKFIKELSIVGLPDEAGERIACLVVPDYEYEPNLSRAQVQANIEEHFRQISSSLPFHKRIRTLEFSEEDLPKTGTRKVKRAQVVKLLQNMLASRHVEPLELSAPRQLQWLIETIAVVSGKPASRIHSETTFDELGFDSLMYAELAAALEASGRKVPSLSGLTAITNMNELAELLQTSSLPAVKEKMEARKFETETGEEHEILIPAALAEAGRVGLDLAQKIFFESVMKVKITGQANIPQHTNFIVAANHSSHLDTGLVKTALGDAGKNLATVAAADYFFDNKYKRAFFESFTNVLPMERTGSIQESVKLSTQALHQGFNLLIFPEGTRSTTGEIAEFKPSLAYLALRARKGILPMYLLGTFEAMPKGSAYPKSRDISATIGPLLTFEALEKLTAGMPKNDAYRLITMIVQELVQQLKSGNFALPDLDAIRQQWNREHQPRLEQAASVIGD